MEELLPEEENIADRVFELRRQRVLFDFDLAEVYGVETRVLKQAVRRNLSRFPDDFMFELNDEEFQFLRSQIVTSNKGGLRYAPFAFTEHGAIMLASVLNTESAVKASIFVVRTFVKLRQLASSYQALAAKMDYIEEKYDAQIEYILQSLEALSQPQNENRKMIGFTKD
ncbi:MAG: ORF6N domain-containing protein [Saprospiraceae bacterium]|nr:ORF6N domain-containing protein [Saprospiraceae bacterium]